MRNNDIASRFECYPISRIASHLSFLKIPIKIRPDHSNTKPKISILTEIKTSDKVHKALLRQTYLFSYLVDADLIVNFESLTEPLNQ